MRLYNRDYRSITQEEKAKYEKYQQMMAQVQERLAHLQ